MDRRIRRVLLPAALVATIGTAAPAAAQEPTVRTRTSRWRRWCQVGANLKKLYAYGLRNSFGMTFDPYPGKLWEQENGDDSFSEINRVFAGFNSGWTQIMGPVERVAQFRSRRTSPRRRLRRSSGGSSCRARASAIRRWRGSTRSRRAGSRSCAVTGSASATGGDFFVVSLSRNTVYEIARAD